MSWFSVFETTNTMQSDGFIGLMIAIVAMICVTAIIMALIRGPKRTDVKEMTTKKKNKRTSKSKNEPLSEKRVSVPTVVMLLITVMALSFSLFVVTIPQSGISSQITERVVPWEERVHTCPICGWQGYVDELDTEKQYFNWFGAEYYVCPECGHHDDDKSW